MKINMFRKKDCILAAGIILTAALSSAVVMFAQRDAGAAVRVTIDGELYGEYSLSGNQFIAIDAASGYNGLVIRDGSAYMAEADCPDKLCVNQKAISKNGESIINRSAGAERRSSVFPTDSWWK